MKKKTCNKCKIEKLTSEFYVDNNPKSKSKIRSICKECFALKWLNYYDKNREKLCEKGRKHYQKEETKKMVRERMKHKRLTDENFRLKNNLRRRINQAVRGTSKSMKTMKLVGCSINELKNHLETQFVVGMSWENYGKKGWHIDHILPCASFDLTDPEQQKKCFHYTNLQPLWADDNYRKKDKII
jgi:hypothetical protein